MRVHIDDIGPSGLEVTYELTVDWQNHALAVPAPYGCCAPGQLRAHLMRSSDDTIHVEGNLVLPLRSICVRCLSSLTISLQVAMSVTLLPATAAPLANEQGELSEDEASIVTYEGDFVDMGQVARDEILLELPMQTLCSTSCQGLCPTCGQNRNLQPCTCAHGVGGGRLAGLKYVKLG